MRHVPSCWNKTLAKLGFRRVPRLKKRDDSAFRRRARIESLEARQMLSINVTTLADVVDSADGVKSLREAIAEAAPGNNEIVFAGSLNGGQILLAPGLGPLEIANKQITITGPGANQLSIDALGQSRVFSVTGAASDVTISGLTISGGNAVAGSGGGVSTEGKLTLNSAAIVRNYAEQFGGGVFVGPTGSLIVSHSTIDSNVSGLEGGGIGGQFKAGLSLQIYSSTVSNNSSATGGGVKIQGPSSSAVQAAVIDSTFSGNSAGSGGAMTVQLSPGGQATVTIVNSTITQNAASSWVGGGVYNVNGATIGVYNSIIASNSSPITNADDAFGSLAGPSGAASSYNLVGAGYTGLGMSDGLLGSRVGTEASPIDPRLAPLAVYSGQTPRHMPLPGSPAIDRGSTSIATANGMPNRAINDPAPDGGAGFVDIGAVEKDRTTVLGDFNGDGREDFAFIDPRGTTSISDDTLTLGINDSTVYHVLSTALLSPWSQTLAGDFDGDGKDELLGQSGGSWSLLNYDDARGASLQTGITIANFSVGPETFVQDANRDGRDDLITRANSGSPWMVSLASPLGADAAAFLAAANWNSWINYGYTAATGQLDADRAYAKVLEEFSWVYNNVELELYPGLMKGPEATEQTKAGNDWDQAALLVERLQDLPFLSLADVQIVSGIVRSDNSNQFKELRDWLGVDTAAAAVNVIRQSLDGNAIPRDANGGSTLGTSTPIVAIEFSHAWVRVKAPTGSGLTWIDLDPSWKFKDRQAGIPLPTNLDANRTERGLFDEIEYLALDPQEDRRLPVEYFEDQVMQWLESQSAHRGSSLADVPFDGPIVTRSFERLPVGLGAEIGAQAPLNLATYEDFDAIVGLEATKKSLTHRVVVRLKNGSNEYWSKELVVPVHSLDSIQITFAANSSAVSDPNSIAPATSSTFYSRLVVGGQIVSGTTGHSFSSSHTATIDVVHLAPEGLVAATSLTTSDPDYVGPTTYDRKNTYSRAPGKIMALSLDANQHSRDSLAALQSQLLAAVGSGATETALRPAIDDLTAYAGAKYWDDFNRYNRAVAGLTRSISVKGWVGSGIAAADPTLLFDPEPEGSNDVLIEYLPYGIAPANFGVDLPNGVNSFLNAGTGFSHPEAQQLAAYNGSALEHNIVEEVISAEAVSTIKGLQRAMQRDLGLRADGQLIDFDSIEEFTSTIVNGTRTYTHVARWFVHPTTHVITRLNVNTPFTSGDYLVQTSTAPLGPLRSHTGNTNLGQSLWSNFFATLEAADGDVSVLVPFGRTQLNYQEENNNWIGAVYLAETQRSILLAIVKDGGQLTNGGYSGGVTSAPPPQLQLGNFVNAGWVGDPVSPANGNMFRDETDIVFPNVGVPLSFSRHYDSQSKDDFGLGVGWMYTFGDLVYQDGSDLVWLDSMGRRQKFKSAGSNTYTTPAGLLGDFSAADPSFYTFKSRDGVEYHFQKVTISESGKTVKGRLTKIVDRDGHGVQVSYVDSSTRRIASVQDVHAATRSLTFAYQAYTTGTYHVSAVTRIAPGTSNLTWNFTHDAIGSKRYLTKAEAPAVLVTDSLYVETSSRPTVQYSHYGTIGHPSLGLMQRITEADGSWHEYEYYANGRAFRVKQGEAGLAVNDPKVDVQTFSYNLLRNLTDFTDERGNVETYIHQKNGLLTKQIHADRSQMTSTWGAIDSPQEFLMLSTTDERGAEETFTYYGSGDPAFKQGQLETSTAKHFSSETPLVTSYDYSQPDATNRPHIVAPSTIVVDPDNSGYVGQKLTTTNVYYGSGDALGKLWKTTDAEGNTFEYTYYPTNDPVASRRGLLKSIKQPPIATSDGSTNPDGTPVTVNYETYFDYDAAGNVKQTYVKNATSNVLITATSFLYDSLGNVVQSTDATSVITESVYDILGRLRETGFDDAGGLLIDPLDAYTSRFKYDAVGRVRESIDPLGRATRFEYDRQGKITRQTNPDGTVATHEYDAFGNCIASTDEMGRTTRFVYDSRNRLIQTIYADGSSARVRYDGVGNLVASVDELGAVTTFKYDAAGRLLETKLPDPLTGQTTASSPTTTNKYDNLGRLVETIDPKAYVSQFQYDKLGRVVQAQTLAGAVGNRTSSSLAAVSTLVALTTTDYDAVGNVWRSAVYDVANSAFDTPAETATLLANPRAVITPGNMAGNLVQVVTTRYDALGRATKVYRGEGSSVQTSTSTVYDPAGRVRFTRDELYNSTTNAHRQTEYVYQPLTGWLAQVVLPDPDGPTNGTTGGEYSSPVTAYAYDGAGNRISTTDPRGYKTTFQYDARNRLAASINPLGSRTRSVYDAAGQMIAAVDALGRASYTRYDDRGRPVLQRSADPDGPLSGVAPEIRYWYDAAGRVAEEVDELGYSTAYEYDALGRLTKETYTTDYQVIDAGSTGFTLHNGQMAPANQPSDYGGNSYLVSPANGANAEMIWRFDNLRPGTYRVLATWSGNPTATTNVIYRLSDYYYGVPTTNFFPEDFPATELGTQRAPATEVERFENGAWHGWKVLNEGYQLTTANPGSLGVHLTAANQPVHADAIRIERLESRSYAYDANGNRTSFIDELGRETTYVHDELDRVTVATLPAPGVNNGAVPLPSSPLLAPQTTTSYDGYGNVVKVLERRGSANHQRQTEYEYNTRNRVKRETQDAGADGVVVYFNYITDYLYDDLGNVVEKKERPGDALERKTWYSYDALGRRFVEIANAGDVAADRRVLVTHFDPAGNVTRVDENPGADPRDLATYTEYDRLGRAIATIEVGRVDGSLRWRATQYQYDAVGNLLATIDPLRRTSRTQYDRLDRAVKSIAPDPDGAGPQQPESTALVYDAAGQTLSETNAAGDVVRYAYDARGLLTRTDVVRDPVNQLVDTTVRQYDSVGNLAKLIDPAGNVTSYVYDGLDRMAQEITSAGSRFFYYDSNGDQVLTVDRNGRAIRQFFDRLGRVTLERWYADETAARANLGAANDPAAYSDALNYHYDTLGRLYEQRQFHRRWHNGAWVADYRLTDSYQYDGLDRLRQHSNQSLENPTALSSLTAPANLTPVAEQTYAYAFDSVTGMLAVTREQLVSGQFAAQTTQLYNGFGQLVKLVDDDGNASGESPALDFEPREAAFSYDDSGAITSAVRRSGYTAGAYASVVRTAYAYDPSGRLSSVGHRKGGADYATATPLVDFVLNAYDPAGRISRYTVGLNTGLPGLGNRPIVETFDYLYDGAGQLKSVDSNQADQDAAYSYGANGNRATAAEPIGSSNAYTTVANNRVSQDSQFSYQYDDEGNIILKEDGFGHRIYYNWDHKNRLIGVNEFFGDHETLIVDYRYNAAGDLVYRREDLPFDSGVSSEHYVVEAGERTMAFEQDGDVKRRYLYGPTGETLFDQAFNAVGAQGLQSQTDLLAPLGDHQHSTRIVLNGQNAAVRQSIDYAPFGRITAIRDANSALVGAAGEPNISALDTVFTHHGSVTDAATALQLKGARWYSTDLGRFVSEDPIQDGANWYMAFGNNPVLYADPSGLSIQGYPLAGGYSGGKTSRSPIPVGALNTTLGLGPYNGSFGATTRSTSSWGLNQLGNLPLSRQEPRLLAESGSIQQAYRTTGAPSVGSRTSSTVQVPLVPAAEEALVRSIGGASIVPRSAADLPGIRGALEQPNRYIVTNHSNQGYNVLDLSQGSMRFVTGDDYLPRAELSRRSEALGRSAAGRIPLLNLTQETLIAFSPFHETYRDLRVAAGYSDPYEPTRPISQGEQDLAAFMFFAPGGNSGMAHYGDEGLDALRNAARKPRNTNDAINLDLLEQQGMHWIPEPSGRGTQNPLVKEAIDYGDIKHMLLQERLRAKGYRVDRADTAMVDPLTGETVYPDSVSPKGHPVEIKPRTPTGQARGESQLPKYERAAGRKGRVIYYDP